MGCCCSGLQRSCMTFGLRFFGCCGCPNPAKYLYVLTRDQAQIISSNFEQFKDVKYLTLQPLDFSVQGQDYTVKCGFATDGVSSGFMCSNWIDVDKSVIHDFLYATHPAPKTDCDDILLPFYRRFFVKFLGNSAWQTSGQRGALVVCRENTVTKVWTYHDANYEQFSECVHLSTEDSCAFDNFFEKIKI